MPDGPPPLVPPIGVRLARAAREVGAAFERAMADAGSSAATWQVLVVLKSGQWDDQRSLAGALGLKAATLTHHLNRMEREGLVARHRDPDNRRRQVVALTREGEALFRRLRSVALEFDERLRGAMSERELRTLAGVLDRLPAAVREAPSRA